MALEGTAGLRRIARELRDTTTDHGRDLARDVRGYGDDARSELSRLWSQIEDIVENRLTPAARDASREARAYYDEGRDVAIDATERLRDATRAHPLLAIGIAAATALVVASLLRGRK